MVPLFLGADGSHCCNEMDMGLHMILAIDDGLDFGRIIQTCNPQVMLGNS
jgi:hypothetical protein